MALQDYISSTLLLSLLVGASACSMEEGYTPIGEDREDSSGVLIDLSLETNEEVVIFFRCEEFPACDLKVSASMTGPNLPEPGTLIGSDAYFLHLRGPDDFSRDFIFAFGDENKHSTPDNLKWSLTELFVPPGEYSYEISLGDIQTAAKGRADVVIGETIHHKLNFSFLGDRCTMGNSDCGEMAFCREFAGVGARCTNQCFMDEQCPSDNCSAPSADFVPMCQP